MEEILTSISNWVLTVLTGAVVWFFKELSKKQSIAEARDTETRLRKEIDELRDLYSKQQDFIFSNVATKADLQNLKEYIKDLLSAMSKEKKKE